MLLGRSCGNPALITYPPELATIADALTASDWPLVEGSREVWRRWGDREIVVQDPDGYLIMVAEDLGERPLRSP